MTIIALSYISLLIKICILTLIIIESIFTKYVEIKTITQKFVKKLLNWETYSYLVL